MMEGVEQIGLFGCQYAGGERGTQRESLIYWIARFEQYGGRVVVPRKFNSLMTQPLYGYASHDEHGKLIPAYRPPMLLEKESPDGRSEAVALVQPADVALMPLPEGEERREFAFA